MDTIETFEVNGHTVRMHPDSDGDDSGNPRDSDMNVGIMLANGHRNYDLGDERFKDAHGEYDDAAEKLAELAEDGKFAEFPTWARETLGATVVKPLWLMDHSSLSMRTTNFFEDPGQWDSGIVGFIFDTAKTRENTGVTPQHVAEALDSEVSQYDDFIQGNVYGYTIEDPTGHEVDSCWGFLGYEYAKESATEAATHQTGPAFVIVRGNLTRGFTIEGPYSSQEDAAHDADGDTVIPMRAVTERVRRLIAPRGTENYQAGDVLHFSLTTAGLKEKLAEGFTLAD